MSIVSFFKNIFYKKMTDRQYYICRIRKAADSMEKDIHLSFSDAMRENLNEDIDKLLE
jgi:hypothetical protein